MIAAFGHLAFEVRARCAHLFDQLGRSRGRIGGGHRHRRGLLLAVLAVFTTEHAFDGFGLLAQRRLRRLEFGFVVAARLIGFVGHALEGADALAFAGQKRADFAQHGGGAGDDLGGLAVAIGYFGERGLVARHADRLCGCGLQRHGLLADALDRAGQ